MGELGKQEGRKEGLDRINRILQDCGKGKGTESGDAEKWKAEISECGMRNAECGKTESGKRTTVIDRRCRRRQTLNAQRLTPNAQRRSGGRRS